MWRSDGKLQSESASVLPHINSNQVISTQRNPGLMPDMTSWKTAHSLTVQAFLEPTKQQDKKRLMQILKRPIPDDIKAKLFDFDKYLHALTSMSLSTFSLQMQLRFIYT